MKVRIKYTKTGPLRFISHLDVMRYFQKAIRRAEFDIAYTKGFSPHQIISFAAPMPLGLTSIGEYCDAEFNSVTSTDDMVERFNAVASEYLKITDIVILPDNAKNSMSVVTGSSYKVTLTDNGKEKLDIRCFEKLVPGILSSTEVNIMKKTKKNEQITNIRPSIYSLEFTDDSVTMLLSAGSVDNLKPELVMEAMCNLGDICYDRYDYNLLRLETYMDDEAGNKIPLSDAGERF